MRWWLYQVWFVLVVLTMLLVLGAYLFREPIPSGKSDLVAQKQTSWLIHTLQLKRWQKAGVLVWKRDAFNSCMWDRKHARGRVVWREGSEVKRVLLSLSLPIVGVLRTKGKWRKLEQSELPGARGRWTLCERELNWLNPFLSLLESDRRRTSVKTKGRRGLLLEGVRGHRRDLFWLDKKNRPVSWVFWGTGDPLSGWTVHLEDWQDTLSGLPWSRTRRLGVFSWSWSSLRVYKALETKEVFAPLCHLHRCEVLAKSGRPGEHGDGGEAGFSWELAFCFWLIGLLVLRGAWGLLPERRQRRWFFPSPVEHPMRVVHVLDRVLPEAWCDGLRAAAEQLVWTTQRHWQATQDQPLQNIPRYDVMISDFLRGEVFPRVEGLYELEPGSIGVLECFVVKYDEQVQQKLDLHRDASLLTLSFALNSDSEYEGGGTYFPCLGERVVLREQGDMLVHCGKIKHGGVSIRSGHRFLLVCFLDCSGCAQFCHEEIASWDSATPDDYEVMRRCYRAVE